MGLPIFWDIPIDLYDEHTTYSQPLPNMGIRYVLLDFRTANVNPVEIQIHEVNRSSVPVSFNQPPATDVTGVPARTAT